jgi:hypothetical protein
MCNSYVSKNFLDLENSMSIAPAKSSNDLISPLASAGALWGISKVMGQPTPDMRGLLYQAGSSYASHQYVADMVLPKLGLASSPMYRSAVTGLVYSGLDYISPYDGRSFIYKTLLSAGADFIGVEYLRPMIPM